MAQVQLEERILSVAQLREIYDPPNSIVLGKVITRFDKHVTGFVQAASFLAAHFRDDRGEPVPVIAGGPRGFARVIDPVTVEIESRATVGLNTSFACRATPGTPRGCCLSFPASRKHCE
jgi:predicted pyridoxine 5'-phosphate oxidase superfamily flavin-nucleotide-binding protein